MAKPDKQESKRGSAKTWGSRIDSAQKVFKKWNETSERIIKRYRDERDTMASKKRRFNILWSNVQVLTPALYGRPAKPEVSRRFKDADPVGRVASTILERALEYEVEQYPDFDLAMRGSVEDRLLPGRGTSWIRYEPHITTEDQVSNDVDASHERVDYECAPVDYVNWRDFLHSPARTWDEVWWVARCVWMTRDEGVKRFKDVFNSVPLEYESKEKTGTAEELPKEAQEQKAKVWEIWDKNKREVIWIADGFQTELDSKPDPLELEEFYPCPRPLYATTTTGSLIPVADYQEYQDQAEELDTLTQRIHLLTRALKVAGVYNGEFKELQRLLREGFDNDMIGVSSWAAFAEKGGMKGAVEFLPIEMIALVIEKLYLAREQCKAIIYEVTGISDIIRGASDAGETATAQQIKANYAGLRLKQMQGDVARYASDILRLKAQVICKKFGDETLLAMSGIQSTEDGQNQQLVQAAMQLLRQGQMKDFRIQVESDSLAQLDEQQEKQDRLEFLTATGSFLKEALPVVQASPAVGPLVGEMLLFGVRGFRVGRDLEAAFEKAIQALGQNQGIPKQVQEQIQAKEQELQKAGAEMQKKGQELQAQEQQLFTDKTNHQVERIQFDADKQVFQKDVEIAKEKMDLQAERKTMEIDRGKDELNQAAKDAQREGKEVEAKKTDSAEIEARNERVTKLAEAVLTSNAEVSQSLKGLTEALPKMAEAVAAVAEAAGADKELVVDLQTGRKRVVRAR